MSTHTLVQEVQDLKQIIRYFITSYRDLIGSNIAGLNYLCKAGKSSKDPFDMVLLVEKEKPLAPSLKRKKNRSTER